MAASPVSVVPSPNLRPTIPGPREAMAIIRYAGGLDRAIHRAASELEGLRKTRIGGTSSPTSKVQKTP